MRRPSVLRAIRMKAPGCKAVCTLLLATFFLAGGLAGMWYSYSCDDVSRAALDSYLQDYCALYKDGAGVSFVRCVQLYFSGTVLAFLFGFSSLGALLIPITSFILGFSAFYTVSCFAMTFGRAGVAAAAALTALRLLFTLPCFLAIASLTWPHALRLAAMVFGHGKRLTPIPKPTRFFAVFALVLVVLTAGLCCECVFTPRLFLRVIGSFSVFSG